MRLFRKTLLVDGKEFSIRSRLVAGGKRTFFFFVFVSLYRVLSLDVIGVRFILILSFFFFEVRGRVVFLFRG